MGSVPSYFGYTPIRLPHPHAHEHLYPQAYHPGPGGFPAGPPPGHSIATPNVELCARLALLERDYQNSQAENAKKEAVIQYLLHSKVDDEPSNNKAADLRDEVLSLKERISELNEDGKQLRSQFQQVLDLIFTLPTPITAGFAAQSAPTNDRDGSKTTNVDVVKTNDLIDLLDCVEGSADAKLSGEDTTLLDDYHDDVSSIGEEPAKTAADQSLSKSLSSDLIEDSSYIHHFVRDESNVNPHEDVKKAAPVLPSASPCDGAADFACIRKQIMPYIRSKPSYLSPDEALLPRLLQVLMALLQRIRRRPMVLPQYLRLSVPPALGITRQTIL